MFSFCVYFNKIEYNNTNIKITIAIAKKELTLIYNNNIQLKIKKYYNNFNYFC